MSDYPRYVIYRGRKCRVTGYEDGRFRILLPNDDQTWVKRERLIFPKTSKKGLGVPT